ncbi:HlyD family secretion protein [Capillibacterium thermochitinicola]|uniref:HlyD family efflux transporter periplasmic adaptor subunit n=1 Tax=Capillibacterium thermochitinicola TaxID=2699427 RepID=A0A8J6HYB1_9FIRM|nr:HlyD family efflux transporter periplasmic adaptor subunit [Capillibacterium thermochitinicola]MBA2133782.1 HlyD family efflux transporter periplasmic adaptor subunit [Capillibacterium thermochitinicola]
MREEIIDLSELTESREMLQAREPKFISSFIWLVLLLFASSFLWMWFGEIDIVVKATGVVRPVGNVSIIRSIYGGKLEQIFYKEGVKVKKGDPLFLIETSSLEREKENLMQKKKRLEKEAENLEKMQRSVQEGKNLFTEEDLHYYNWFLSYHYDYKQLHLVYLKTKSRYQREKNLGPGVTSEVNLEELRTEYLLAEINRDRHKSKMLVEIKERLEANQVQLLEVQKLLEEVEEKIKMHQITAPIDGVVQVLQQFNSGDYLPAGVEILRIIPVQGTGMKVDLMVKNKDIGNLTQGQKVNYRFLALPYKEYGSLSGEVTNIAGDAQIANTDNELVYLVEGSLEGDQLIDKKGQPAKVKVGMLCEARVVVKKRRILYFILEKMNLLS